MTKPFDTEELLARVSVPRCATARVCRGQGGDRELVAGEVDDRSRSDRRDHCAAGEEVRLTPKEYGVVAELAKFPGRVITHDQLLRSVWGNDQERHVEYLRVVIRNIRQKIEPDPSRPAIIVNELGIGYRLMGADG